MNLILINSNQVIRKKKDDGDGSIENKVKSSETKTGSTVEVVAGSGGASSVFFLEASDKQSKHIISHLKKTVGSRLRVGLVPNGPIGEAVIVGLPGNGSVHLALDPTTLRPAPRKPLVRILLGVPYPKVTLALWPVMTSLGVEHIVYAPATLTEPSFLETSKLQPAVYEPLLREGLSQAEDTQPPRVTVHKNHDRSILKLLLEKGKELEELTRDCCKIVLHIGDYDSIRQSYLRSQKQHSSEPKKGIFLAIGPERGWTDQEAGAFRKAGFEFASLGDPILRTDTAVVSALALARDVLLEEHPTAIGAKRKLEEP